jgi:hypothetical protein
LEKLLAVADRVTPKDLAIKGGLHILLSLIISYMAFFVGTFLAVILITCAVLNSGYGQWLICHPDNRQSE